MVCYFSGFISFWLDVAWGLVSFLLHLSICSWSFFHSLISLWQFFFLSFLVVLSEANAFIVHSPKLGMGVGIFFCSFVLQFSQSVQLSVFFEGLAGQLRGLAGWGSGRRICKGSFNQGFWVWFFGKGSYV